MIYSGSGEREKIYYSATSLKYRNYLENVCTCRLPQYLIDLK